MRFFEHFSLKTFKAVFFPPADEPELLRARFAAFSKQIPLLYFILTIDTLASAFTFVHLGPVWLSLYLPIGLSIFCVLRCVWWWRTRQTVFSDAQIVRYTRLTTQLTVILTAAYTCWGLVLYGYGEGDAYARGQIVFSTCLSVIGCTFCLMQLRPAALSVTLFANTPFILFFFFIDPHPAMKVIAVNLALVSIVMILVLMTYSRDFETLVHSKAETRRLSEDNFRIANLDALTDLSNRRWFFAELDGRFLHCVSRGGSFAVGIIDLDGFKPVNDTYGHATGDRVLAEVARRLTRACGDKVVLARLGGDEFGFIMADDPSPNEIRALGSAINEAINVPFAVGSSQALLGASIGVAVFPQSADTPESLFERADYALYHSKRHQRGQTVVFSSEHEEQIRSHGVVEQALQNADLDAELSLVFQPIIDLRNGATVAFEALARWQSPVLGAVGPDRFIAVAERAGLIRPLTRILLKKALAALAQWPADTRISFNLSAHDLSDAEAVLQIVALINRSGIAPRRLDFEITETAMAQDFKQARAAVATLKALGVGISLDDFGTGYSSLSQVHRLTPDKIKVDRSFIAELETHSTSLKIVKSLTALCGDMGLTCIIEGVETKAQLAILRDLGCQMAQGYYFSRPMAESDVPAWLGREKKRA